MTEPIRGIVVCVEYDDLLAITLPAAMRHLTECLVVTSPTDEATKSLATSIPGVRVYETDAFYRHGASFNKGLALEEGFDALGRRGWILLFDADTVLPRSMPLLPLQVGRIYGPTRRMLADASRYHDDLDWYTVPPKPEREIWGYFQLFHADDPYLRTRPWYDCSYVFAAGSDTCFQGRWPPHRRTKLPFEVLHLGPWNRNWFGRVSPRLDGIELPDQPRRRAEIEDLLNFKGWNPDPPTRPIPATYDDHIHPTES